MRQGYVMNFVRVDKGFDLDSAAVVEQPLWLQNVYP